MDIRVGFSEFDALAGRVCVGWCEFDCLDVSASIVAPPPQILTPGGGRARYDSGKKPYSELQEAEDEQIILALLMEIAADVLV